MKYFCMLCERDFLDSTSCFNHVLECGGVVKNHKTPRDEFAMAAMSFFVTQSSPEECADLSYQYADAMLNAREQKK